MVMKKKEFRLIRHRLIAVVMLSLFLVGCGRRPQPSPEAETVPTISVAPVEKGAISEWISLTGDVRARSTVVLSPKVGGRLEELGVWRDGAYLPLTEGLAVRAGETYARIDRQVYEQRLAQARAAADVAAAQFEDALREEARLIALHAQGSATDQARDRAITARRVAEAARAQAEAARRLAEIEFAESAPRVPMDGVITRKYVDEGNLVAVGTPLAALEDIAVVRVVFGVPERYAHRIEAGRTRVQISGGGLPDNGVETVVSRRHPSADPATRNVTVEVELPNADGALIPGSFAYVRVETASRDDALLVPVAALGRGSDGDIVFVVEGDRARVRRVRVGLRDERHAEILEGLRAGESIAVEAVASLQDGQRVIVRAGGRP